jgi:hypothetical protein
MNLKLLYLLRAVCLVLFSTALSVEANFSSKINEKNQTASSIAELNIDPNGT